VDKTTIYTQCINDNNDYMTGYLASSLFWILW